MQGSEKKVKILFLCTGNSCRSQMAEGWVRHLKDDLIEPYSAGVEASAIDPRSATVMKEAGVDISRQRSKPVEEIMHIKFEYVVTLCGHAQESCPIFPGKTKVVHQGFDDPPRMAEAAKNEKEVLQYYRRVRDAIRDFVERLPDSLETLATKKDI